MSPPKQPCSLFKISIKTCINIINSACYIIEKSYPENQFPNCECEAFNLKCYLMSILPVRLFDVLCSERTCCQYRGDPRIQLHVLTHPNMTAFRKCNVDNSIPQGFWIDTLSKFSKLVVLDLKFICTDEILQVIGPNCPLLEEINIVSRVDVSKSFFNASVLKRNVSDSGLCSVATLKNLRILAMDPPRNERAHRIGRCVSQAGIILLMNSLPLLEELRIESCNIGSILIDAARYNIGPLNLKKVNYHFASPEGIRQLIKICPYLKEFSIVHFFEHSNKDEILEVIAESKLGLDYLDLSFFSYGKAMELLLSNKGSNLTYFSLWEIEHSVTLDVIISIGKLCPNLNTFCLMTQSKTLIIPKYFKPPEGIFNKLQNLTIGCDLFRIDHVLTFFSDCTNLQKLDLKYQSKCKIDDMLMNLLKRGCFRDIVCLWFDCTLEVSKSMILRIIQTCDNLQMFTVDMGSDANEIQKYIIENNYDLKLGSY